MNALLPHRLTQPTPLLERRINIAMRTPQLVTSRYLLFLVGGLCLVFGVLTLWLEQINAVPGEAVFLSAPSDDLTDGGKARATYEMHLLQTLIAGFGLLTVVLAFLIYRAPMMVAMVVSITFAGIFYAFLRLNHSNLPALYVLASLPILAVTIKTIFSAVQFNQSFARMGRPEDH